MNSEKSVFLLRPFFPLGRFPTTKIFTVEYEISTLRSPRLTQRLSSTPARLSEVSSVRREERREEWMRAGRTSWLASVRRARLTAGWVVSLCPRTALKTRRSVWTIWPRPAALRLSLRTVSTWTVPASGSVLSLAHTLFIWSSSTWI